MSTVVKNPTKVITGPKTRWSYANVWDPKSINGGAPKYSVSLIIPKSDTKTILTQVAISLMPIVLQLPELSMQTDSLFLRDPKFIPVCMAELPSTFMLSIATEIRESPAVSIIFRRFPMVSLLVVSPEPRTISHPMMMTNSSINHKYKSHFNLLWGGGAKLPPYFITERKIYERIVNRFRNI